MKTICQFLLFTITALFWYACEGDEIVGSEDVDLIEHVSFTIMTYEVSSDKLTASGVVENIGSDRITPPWHIDGEFYADGTQSLILGGDVEQMNISLKPGIKTPWTLKLSDPDIVETNFPDFVVSNLRAYYKK